MPSKYFNRAAITELGPVSVPTDEVPMREWTPGYDPRTDELPDGTEPVLVVVRGFTGAEADRLRAAYDAKKIKAQDYRVQLIMRGVIDDEGNRVFSLEDAEWLNSQPARATNRIIRALTKLNGDDLDEALADAEKNSDSGRESDSSLS